MKKIEIEIPEGKDAQWVNGVLTLVDEKPQDITERIKTFEDACSELGDAHPLVKEYWGVVNINLDIAQDLIAYLKLRIICAALNEGWEPIFDEDELRYYVHFYIYSKSEYEKLNDGMKKKCVNIFDALDYLAYAHASSPGLYSYTNFGVRLALRTRELAEYCGNQFVDIWADFLFK